MSLIDVPLLREYRSYKNNIVKEFYIPVLKEANKYQRAVGFFTSDALIELSKGISGFTSIVDKSFIIDLYFSSTSTSSFLKNCINSLIGKSMNLFIKSSFNFI